MFRIIFFRSFFSLTLSGFVFVCFFGHAVYFARKFDIFFVFSNLTGFQQLSANQTFFFVSFHFW